MKINNLQSLPILVLICLTFYGFVTPEPPKIEDKSTYEYVRILRNNINKLQVVTTDPNGTRLGDYGDLLIYRNGSVYSLAFNISSPNGKTWVKANSFNSNGAIYGSMFAKDVSVNVPMTDTITYVEIPSGWTFNGSNAVNFSSSKGLQFTTSGTYLFIWSIAVKVGTASQEIEGILMKNGVTENSTINATESSSANKNTMLGGTGIFSVNAGDIVSLAVLDETAIHDITFTHGSVTCIRIGQ